MAVRRTSNISTEISVIDRRLRTLESSAGTSTSAGTAVTTSADDENPPATGGLRGNSAPYQYKRVYEAWIYGPKVTGNTSRAELYFEDDPEIEPGDYVRVQGINGNTANEIDISSSDNGYKVFATDTPPWDDADVREEGVAGQLRRSWRDTPPANIDYTVFYNPVVVPPADSPTDSGLQLISTRLMDSVTASNTTVTVNFNSNHRFAVGDVLYWDLPESLLDGYADRLFKVSAVVDSNTVQYELETALTSPISLSSGDLTDKFVYAVAHRYVEDGTIWIDTSVEPNRVYVWKDYRWYDTAESPLSQVPGADSIAPSPVTNLSATSEVSTPAGPTTSGRSSITLTWDAPTTNENATPLTDLGGYSVWWRYTIAEPWRIVEIDDPTITTWFADDFVYNVSVLLAVYAKDKFGNRSTAATTSILTSGTPAEVLAAPSAPTITGYLGTMKVYWNGLDANGDPAATAAFEVQLHISATNGFTATSSTLFERFPAINGATYTVIPGNAIIGGTEIVDGQTYYFRFKFVDIWGNTTSQSAQGSFVAQKSDIVTFDMIDVGTITGEILIGADIRTAANPSSTGGIALDSTGLTAYNNVGVQTFNISSATGAVTITGYATDGELASVESVAISANSIAVTANNTANSANSTAITANGIAVTANNTANSANSTAITANGIAVTANTTGNTAITRINAGDITITKAKAIGAVNEGVDPGNTTTISGGTIKTNSISASSIVSNSITATQISSAYVYAGTISANNITSGVITGSSIQTAASNKRILLSRTSNSAVFYDDNGTEVGRVEGVTTGGGSLDLAGRGTASINIGVASTVFSGNISTSGTAGITAAGRLAQVQWALVGTRIGGVSYNDVGQLVPAASDLRIKTNIDSINSGLEKINSLNPVVFNWKTDENNPSKVPGLIAQEVSEVFPEAELQLVRRLPDTGAEGDFVDNPMMAVDYEGFIPYLIKAIQELSQQNLELQARIAALEGTT